MELHRGLSSGNDIPVFQFLLICNRNAVDAGDGSPTRPGNGKPGRSSVDNKYGLFEKYSLEFNVCTITLAGNGKALC